MNIRGQPQRQLASYFRKAAGKTAAFSPEAAPQKGAEMEIKSTYLGTMIGLATVAFGLIAASAWNQFIRDLIGLFLKPGSGIWAEFLYAMLVTILAIVVVRSLAKLAEKETELRARLPFAKKPDE